MPTLNLRHCLLIVVGTDLEAEFIDRPLAYHLQKRILKKLPTPPSGGAALIPLVCSDVWYVNQKHLNHQAIISLGSPAMNAVTAFLEPRVPMAISIDQQLSIRFDLMSDQPTAAIWGHHPEQAHNAIQLFEKNHLATFLDRCAPNDD